MANPSKDFDKVIEKIIVQRGFPDSTRITNVDIARYIENCPTNRKPESGNTIKARFKLVDAVNKGMLPVKELDKEEKYLALRVEDPVIFRVSVLFEKIQNNGRTINGYSQSH